MRAAGSASRASSSSGLHPIFPIEAGARALGMAIRGPNELGAARCADEPDEFDAEFVPQVPCLNRPSNGRQVVLLGASRCIVA